LWREIVETVLLTVLIYAAVNLTTGRFRIESVSMMPNLQPGEYVLVDKVSYHFVAPQRGDIVVFHHPLGERDLIKRVIGLPGETIEIANGVVNINGQPIDELYIAAPPGGGGAWTLGPTQLFVMGDNRNNSSDSRAWGPLERDLLVGKTIFIYWPPSGWGLVPHYTYAASD
jgi:signal peptidase I